jgi:hypothetical protein
MSIRPEVVGLLVSCDLKASDEAAGRLVHENGLPFSDEETRLYLSRGPEELNFYTACLQSVLEHRRARDWNERVVVVVRLSAGLIEDVYMMARNEHRPVNAQLVHMLEQYSQGPGGVEAAALRVIEAAVLAIEAESAEGS